jgi:hypothetical protein
MDKKMKETWKPISEFKGYYVSNFGNLKSDDGILDPKISINGHGYEYVKIHKYNKYVGVHRVVAKTFIPNPESLICVHHIDHNKTNNRADNLQWVTYSQNFKEAWIAGRFDSLVGENSHKTILTNKDVREIRKMRSMGIIYRKISEKFNISISTAHGVVNGRVWDHVK